MSDTDTWALPQAASLRKWDIARFRPYALVAGIYVFATLLTAPSFQGDTIDYVYSIAAHSQGRYLEFWEFGHLLWRPFGWAAWRISGPLLSRLVGPDLKLQISAVLIAISWLAGLMAALLLLALLRSYEVAEWVCQLVAASFVFSMAVLDYSRTGCSYIPGLCLLLLSMYLMARASFATQANAAVPIGAAVALAGSVSLWFLYVLAVPGVVFLPYMSDAHSGRRLRLALTVFLVFCLSISAAYLGVLFHLGLTNVPGIVAWVQASSHGTAIRGISRMIFGWPRSFVDVNLAGKVIKRFLLHDPFNPVSRLELVKLWPDLLKLGLFYLAVFATTISLGQSSRGKSARLAAGIAAVPVLAFAIYWSGGNVERYLPLYPFFFLALCICLARTETSNGVRMIVGTFLICTVMTNAVSQLRASTRQIESRTEERVNPLLPVLTVGSSVVVSHNLDDLVGFTRNFPFNSINVDKQLSVYALVTPGQNDVAAWRSLFASEVLATWRRDGDLWVSSRLLREAPLADWNWIEGDDHRASWKDFYRLFSQLQYGKAVGADDGFLLLLRSPRNEDSLTALASK